jgi:heme a synthase
MINTINREKWSKIIFWLWIYTLTVILWGAWVRISHSGDGCGTHWPLCEGQIVPSFQKTKTWIEYAHRLMSGTYGLLVLFIYVKISRSNVSARIKKLNLAFLVLMITEALLGAVLVKGQLVTVDDSLSRLVVMIFHQLNSFFLTGVTYVYYLSLRAPAENDLKIKRKYLVWIFLILPITGAIAALSTTLFPAISVWQGIIDDFSTQTHPFIRLRILHPLLASLIAGGFILWSYIRGRTRLAIEFSVAFAIGFITLLTLSPTYLKLAHLLLAHLIWARLLQMLLSLPDSNKR